MKPVSRICAACRGLIGPEQPLVRGQRLRASWHVRCAPPLTDDERAANYAPRRFLEPIMPPEDRVALQRLVLG